MTAETSNARGETYTFDMIEDAWGDAVPLTKPYFDRFRARLESLRQSAAPPPAAAEPKTLPVPTRVYLTDKAAVIVGTPGRGWDEEGPDAHNCDAMGCATIGPHVLARVPFTDERALPQPAEAQAQGGGEVVQRLRGVLEHGKMGDKCLIAPDLVTAAIAALSAQQPPAEAQPVACIECEGEGYTYADDGETTEPCLPCGGSGVRQQPPSAPVGVEWPVDELSREKTLKVLREHNAWRRGAKGPQTDPRMLGLALDAAIAALAQQPAAVGEAYPTPRNRAEAVALARLALAHLGVIDAHIDAAIARCETDLAAQPQGDK